ncbi:hypothetical protein AAU57_08690 [Nonlabens sp. YIK11]|uniref:DUF2075 domain-containing protein n=1 Tax=Nonlabens sp. YIK11 TaxID=1453349 RepID=UPI0006DD35BC|nr:DUF2075 domain-containing protein [Nonlabens sp. YIK11]KQC33380.1 hypothetical protein AAU57_08690 [Nonlabens sp. YIK11]
MSDFLPTNFEINSYIFHGIDEYNVKDNYTLNNYPIVYIIYDLESSTAYVGESTNALQRMQNHLSHPEKKKLKYVYIISSPNFNKSATLDIESYLIKYMVADEKFILLNGNAGIVDHNYYQKPAYYEVFKNIWENLKLQKVAVKDILQIDNSDLFKYSPYKALTADQHKAIYQYLKLILNRSESTVFVQGSAGTGKTILAVYLIKMLLTKVDIDDYEDAEGINLLELEFVKEIQESNRDLKIALVVPMVSLRKTLENVFRNVKGLKPSMVIGPSAVTKQDYDILIVDEAHRLKRRKGITNYRSHDNNNRLLGYGNEGTELDWIMRCSKHQLFFYDSAQSIRPSDIPQSVFDKLKVNTGSHVIELTSQLRAKGGVDYIRFVDRLLNHQLPEVAEPFNATTYDLKLFKNMSEMVDVLRLKESEYGLSRMMAGYGWKWKSKNANVPDAIIDGIELTWNRVPHDWINSTKDLKEIGCIHTVQGYDLNYAGVIFGNEIKYDAVNHEIYIDKENYYDTKGSVGIDDPNQLKEYVINIYKTMMYRGILGTYVYVVDDELRGYLSKYINLKG